MTEEYLDIVDENDNVIGKDTRKAVHANYMIHRGVHIFVVNSHGQILIQKRSMNKDYYPGYFDISVGAQVSSGESYEEAAKPNLQIFEIACMRAREEPIKCYYIGDDLKTDILPCNNFGMTGIWINRKTVFINN